MSIYKPGRPFKYNPITGHGHRPPNAPGEYRIRELGSIVYVGETNNLARRMGEHVRNGKLQSADRTIEFKVADGRSTSRTRREHERAKIAQHSPMLNKSKGGEGRYAGK